MADRQKYKGMIIREAQTIPFETVEEAWFWFIIAQQAKNDGARFTAGISSIARPCEPIDILKILDDLYRQRRLMKEHFLVLRHYGVRNIAPDARRVKEARSAMLWREAMERIEPVLIRKGIVRKIEGENILKFHDFVSERMAAE